MPQSKNLNLENKSRTFNPLKLLWLLPLALLLGIIYLAVKPATMNFSGEFLDSQRKPIADSSYDFRVIAYDRNNVELGAKLLQSWDLKNINVKNGKFAFIINPSIFSLPATSYIQVCYLPNSQSIKNPAVSSIPSCNLTSNDKTNVYTQVSCTRKLAEQGLSFNVKNLLGLANNNLVYSSNSLGCTSVSTNTAAGTAGNQDLINNFPFANFLSTEQKQQILDQRTEFVQNIISQYLQNNSISTNSTTSTSSIDNDKQKLTLDGSKITIENGNTIDIAQLLSTIASTNNYYTNGSDSQKLVINGQTLTITNGNSITLPTAPGQVPQILSYNSGVLSLSNGGGSVILPTDQDVQQLSISGSTISLTNGGSITLPAPATDLYVTSATLSNASTNSGSTSRTLTLTRSGGLPDLTITIPDNDTLFTAGSGLILSSNVFAIKPCADNQILKYNSTTSDWVCSADNDTTYTAGDGIVLNSNTFSLKVCSTSELLVYNGSNWVCVPDLKYTYTAGTGIDITGNQVTNTGTLSVTGSGIIGVTSGQNQVVSLNPCADDQILVYNSSAWTCVNYSTLDKYHDTISTTDSGTGTITHQIDLTGPNGTPSLSTNIVDADSQHLTYDSATRTLAITGTNGNSTVNSVVLPADKYLASASISTSLVTSGSTSRNLTLTMSDGAIYTVTIPDNDTLYTAGNGMNLSGTTFAVNSPACNSNQRLSWNGSAFSCVSYIAGSGIDITGDTISNTGVLSLTSEDGIVFVNNTDPQNPKVGLTPCSEGEVYKFTGGIWKCVAEYSYNFSITDGSNTEQIDNANVVTYKADRGLEVEVSGTDTVTYRLPKCDVGYIMQYDGSIWTCAKDNLQYYDESVLVPNTQPTANGDYSVAIGDGANTTSKYSVILGADSREKGDAYNAILGGVNVIEGNYGVITGYGNGILNGGEFSSIVGFKNAIETSNISNIFGQYSTITKSDNSTILGQNSNITDSAYVNVFAQDSTVNGSKEATLLGKGNILTNSAGVTILGLSNEVLNSESTSVVGSNNYVEKSTQGGVFGYGNKLFDNQSYILGSNLSNLISGSVQIGTDDAQKTTIYNNGDLEFHGALMPAGNPGTNGQVLISQGVGTEPVWTNVGSLLTAGSGVTISGSTISVNAPTTKCASNERITWDPAGGGQFTCAKTNFTITDGTNSQTIDPTDTVTFKTGSTGALTVLVSSTDSVTYDLKACSTTGQVLKYNTTTATWDCKPDIDLYHTAISNTNTQSTTGSGVITNKIDITSSNGAPLLTTTLTDYDNQVLSYNTTTRVVSLSGPNGVGVISNFTLPTDLYVTGATMSSTTVGSGSIVRTLTLTRSGGLPDIVISLPDNDTLYVAGSGLTLTANQFSINAPTCAGTQKLTWTGTAFSCLTDQDVQTLTFTAATNQLSISNGNTITLPYLTTEVDGIIGNEIVNVGTSTALVRSGAGTAVSPYTVDLKACATNEVLKYNATTSIWSCSADNNSGGTVTNIATGNGLTGGPITSTGTISINAPTCAGTQKLTWNGTAFVCANDVDTTNFNIQANGGTITNIAATQNINFINGTGTVANVSGNNVTYNLTNTGVVTGTYNNVTVDAQGRVTSGSNISYLTTEVDGVIGNEVLNATTNMGLIRSGTGTSADPYTLGLIACSNGQVLKSNGTTWACGTDNDAQDLSLSGQTLSLTNDATSVTLPVIGISAGTGINVSSTSGVFTITSTLGTTIDTTEIVDGTIGLADLSSMGCSNGQILKYNGTAWSCAADAGLTSEVDGVIGNEVLNITIGTSGTTTTGGTGALIRSGTVASGYGLDLKACANQQILKYNTTGNTWDCALDNNSGGTVTNIATGNGLTGGPITSTGTISINAPTCAGTQKLTWNGTAFVCANDVDTTYSAGTGITLTGTVFSSTLGTSIESSEITDGTIATTDLADQSVTRVKLANCTTNGQILVYYATDPDGLGPLTTGWNCDSGDPLIGNEVTNATSTVNAANTRTDGIGLIRSGLGTTANPYTLDIKSCADGQIMKYYTTAPSGGYIGWNCVAELPQVLVIATKTATVNLSGTQVSLNYNSATLNVGTAYNTTTGVFTAPANGYYQIDASMMYGYTNGTGAQVPAINLRKVTGTVSILESANGIVNDCCIATGISQSVSVTATVQLNAGEQIDFTHYLKATIAGTNTVSSTNTAGSNRLTITRIQ